MTAKRLGMVGAAVLMAGGALLGTAVAASAGTPTISFTPNTAIGANQGVLVTASGFPGKTKGGLSQCEIGVTGEPTIADATTGQAEPVSCGPFQPIKTTAKGGLPNPTGYGISAGYNGPPESGNDSAGTDATADSANYPCPPTAAQAAAGATCVLRFATAAASADLTINYNFQTTTTTTAPPAQNCTAASNSTTSTNTTAPHNVATVTVNPATCLVAGSKVTVTGSGLVPGSVGSLLECNSDTGQPSVTVLGTAVPVSCTPIAIFTTSSTGTVPTANQSFTVLVGTTGPPGAGTDTAGADAATDAAKYPCPPTAAEVTAGDTCVIAVGDLGGDKVAVPIKFAPGNLGSNPPGTTKAATATTAPSKTAATTKTNSGSLAFTGAGPGLWVLGFIGLALILLGGSLLVLVDAPRRLFAVALRRGDRSSGPPT